MRLMRLTITCAFLLFSLLPSLHAQFDWQRVDQSEGRPIAGLDIRDLFLAPDGTPVLLTTTGIYRIERDPEISGSYDYVRTDSIGDFRKAFVSSSGRIFVEANFLGEKDGLRDIYVSDNSGRDWRPWGVLKYGQYIVEPFGDGLLIHKSALTLLDSAGNESFDIPLPSDPDISYRTIGVDSEGRIYASEDWDRSNSKQPWVSTDTGRTWQKIPVTYKQVPSGVYPYPQKFQIVNDSVFIRGFDGGWVISHDRGRTWRLSSPDITFAWKFLNPRIGVTPEGFLWASGDREVAATGALGFGLYISPDFGGSWFECREVRSGMTIVGGDNMIISAVDNVVAVAPDCNGPWVSPDHFRTVRVVDLESSGEILYALTRVLNENHPALTGQPRTPNSSIDQPRMQLYRSADGGENWTRMNDSLYGECLYSDSLGGLYTATQFGNQSTLYRSSDGGSTWLPVAPPVNFKTDVCDYSIFSRSSGLIAIERGGPSVHPLYSNDSGKTFEPIPDWGPNDSFRAFSIELMPDGIIAGCGWMLESLGVEPGMGCVAFDPVGSTSTVLSSFPDSVDPRYTSLEGERFYVYGTRTLLLSVDGGYSWETIDLPQNAPHTPTQLAAPYEDLMYAESRNSGTLLSRDTGRSWEEPLITTEWDRSEGSALAPRHYLNGIPLVRLPSGVIYDNVFVDGLHPIFGDSVQNHYFTFGRSTDHGRTWDFPVDEDLHGRDVTDIVLSSSGTIIVGTDGDGIYRADPASSVREEISVAPEDLTIMISPNPVRDHAKITFYLDHTSDEEVTLGLYDLLGRRVDILYRGKAEQGSYPVEADFSRLAGGFYFLRVQRGDEGRTAPVAVE